MFVFVFFFFFFFNDTATTEIYTLSLHDALPIFSRAVATSCCPSTIGAGSATGWNSDRRSTTALKERASSTDRKSTRLNSSHSQISYAVFCLKKKKRNETTDKHWYNKQITSYASP